MKNPEASSPTSPLAGAPQSWRPSYWKEAHGTAWDNVREAFSRDWVQTKTDVTGKGPLRWPRTSCTASGSARRRPWRGC